SRTPATQPGSRTPAQTGSRRSPTPAAGRASARSRCLRQPMPEESGRSTGSPSCPCAGGHLSFRQQNEPLLGVPAETDRAAISELGCSPLGEIRFPVHGQRLEAHDGARVPVPFLLPVLKQLVRAALA